MNRKSIWQHTIAATLIIATAGTVALAADTLTGARGADGSWQLASKDDDRDDYRVQRRADDAGEQAQWIGIGQALAAVTAAGYHDVREIERERDGYEAKALDAQGQRWELKLDGRSGEIISRERD